MQRAEHPVSVASQRAAVEARRLCDEMGHCCDGHDLSIVIAAVSGLISMLPTHAQAQMMATVAQRLNSTDIADVPITPEDAAAIDKIVGGAA
jgi:hypothetical protein